MKIKIPQELSWLPDDVIYLLRTRPKEFISRAQLLKECGLPNTDSNDRYLREAIRLLRKDGQPIVSSSGQAGYSFDPDQVDVIIAELESRIIDLSATIKALRRGRVKDEQMKLEIG